MSSADVEKGLQALGYVGSSEDPEDDTAIHSSPEIHNNLGRVHLGKGALDAALKEFQEALRLDASNAEALLNIGDALLGKCLSMAFRVAR